MSVYLHFLDRELRGSVGWVGSNEALAEAFFVAHVIQEGPTYLSLSLFSESCFVGKALPRYVKAALKSQQLVVISQFPTVREFIASRQELYRHDSQRYPMYFEKDASLKWPAIVLQQKVGDTTRSLQAHLYALPFREDLSGTPVNSQVLEILHRGLDERGSRAITYAAFEPYCKGLNPAVIWQVRRLISQAYAEYYLSNFGGTILRGIPGLTYYDRLPGLKTWLNFPVAKALLGRLLAANDTKVLNVAQQLIQSKGSSSHLAFCAATERFVRVIQLAGSGKVERSPLQARLESLSYATTLQALVSPVVADVQLWFVEAARSIKQALDLAVAQRLPISEYIEEINIHMTTQPARILLHTATDLEDGLLRDMLLGSGMTESTVEAARGVYNRYVSPELATVFHVRSRMGTTGANAATTTLMSAIEDLKPDYVICCGIAFGRGGDKQQLGDVLLSEWVRMYEPQRVGAGGSIIPRGDRIPADGKLLQLASLARFKCDNLTVWPGGILSGDKLVDDGTLKQTLINIEIEAIGGEMEAAGVVSACTHHHIPWLIIKGICDWAENKTSKEQEKAARNAFRLVGAMIQLGVLRRH